MHYTPYSLQVEAEELQRLHAAQEGMKVSY
jgi:hypothetical protein